MRKVLSFSAFLVVGLFIAQYLPAWSGSDYSTVKTVSNVLLYICLGFIMINVGRSKWTSPDGKHTQKIILSQWLQQPCLGF